uniref:Large S protein n=1 Tax=Hepatitis B virus TaxID=10407 RepID=D2X429_HBV|nr:large S protein [Hepatitis B virus]
MGGSTSKPRKGMGTNLSVPNPLGFFPDHQLDPAFGAHYNKIHRNPAPVTDHWFHVVRFHREPSSQGSPHHTDGFGGVALRL